jgi:hypothetical protein
MKRGKEKTRKIERRKEKNNKQKEIRKNGKRKKRRGAGRQGTDNSKKREACEWDERMRGDHNQGDCRSSDSIDVRLMHNDSLRHSPMTDNCKKGGKQAKGKNGCGW